MVRILPPIQDQDHGQRLLMSTRTVSQSVSQCLLFTLFTVYINHAQDTYTLHVPCCRVRPLSLIPYPLSLIPYPLCLSTSEKLALRTGLPPVELEGLNNQTQGSATLQSFSRQGKFSERTGRPIIYPGIYIWWSSGAELPVCIRHRYMPVPTMQSASQCLNASCTIYIYIYIYHIRYYPGYPGTPRRVPGTCACIGAGAGIAVRYKG